MRNGPSPRVFIRKRELPRRPEPPKILLAFRSRSRLKSKPEGGRPMRIFNVRHILPLAVAVALLPAQERPKKLSVQQMEEFLKGAKIVDVRELETGVTHSQRANLSDGTIEHRAHVQSI